MATETLRRETTDISGLQQGMQGFTELYEQHAYRVYNLALRITCEPEPAIRAVERTFLGQLDSEPDGLIAPTVIAALAEARDKPRVSGGGTVEAERYLAATGRLRPPERAAIALAALTGAGATSIAGSLRLAEDAAVRLLERAHTALATGLRMSSAELDATLVAWPWAPPPDTIWERLYPRAHEALERTLRGSAGAGAAGPGAEPLDAGAVDGAASHAAADMGPAIAPASGGRSLGRLLGRLLPGGRSGRKRQR